MKLPVGVLLVGLAVSLAAPASGAPVERGTPVAVADGNAPELRQEGTTAGRKRGPVRGEERRAAIPKGLYTKPVRLDVDLESFADGAFGASLNRVLNGVPRRLAAHLTEELDGTTFAVTVDARTTCLAGGAKVPCAQLAALVGETPGGVRATVFARPQKQRRDAAATTKSDAARPPLAFVAKRIAVA